MNTLQQELLEAASRKPIKKFLQFDVFQRMPEGDDIIRPDDDGDCLMAVESYELKNVNELRVFVPVNRTAKEIIRGLKKVIECIEADPSVVDFDLDRETNHMKYLLDLAEEKTNRLFNAWDAKWQPSVDNDPDGFPF